MANNLQEQEFAVFGIVNKKLRAGLLIGLLSISIIANGYLVIRLFDTQKDLYNQMLDRMDKTVDKKVNEKLDEPVARMRESVDNVNSSVSRVNSIADSTSELNGQLEKKLRSKK
jgi:phosphoribosylaminoimidazole (AIR) synthetase